jgi:hypothetical protein
MKLRASGPLVPETFFHKLEQVAERLRQVEEPLGANVSLEQD